LETAVLPLNDAPFGIILTHIPAGANAPAILFSRDPRLLVERVLAAPVAELLELDLALNQLLVFRGVIIMPFAHGATERDQFVCAFGLGHAEYNSRMAGKMQLSRRLLLRPT
jgi:hypothetical protein